MNGGGKADLVIHFQDAWEALTKSFGFVIE
jgi:hypothetical protein